MRWIFFISLILIADLAMAETQGLRTNSIGMVFVTIPSGSFLMGQEREAEGKDITLTYGDAGFLGGELDEQPVHPVKLSRSFEMSVAEVSNLQYEEFDPAHRKLRGAKAKLSTEDDDAVIFVSWHEATAFCQWLSKKEAKSYRLPTEAEWEYACRAGTTTHFNTGDTLPAEFQKQQTQSSNPSFVSLRVSASPPNAWGLHDMHGNFEEWCYDWYGSYVADAQTDPVGRADGLYRVTRGGSHNTYVRYLRSANRMAALPEDKHWLIGFRVVQGELPATKPLPPEPAPLWAERVRQETHDWSHRPDPETPYFAGPIPFVRQPDHPESVPFFYHNHCPSITWCPNGDLLAAWFSGAREQGRELTILASRLRAGRKEWDPPSKFMAVPDRNMHATSLFNDGQGKLYHLNGVGTDGGWSKLAFVQRTSEDNGAMWTRPRFIQPEHINQIVHMNVIITSTGDFIQPVDGGGTRLYISRDRGLTWNEATGPERHQHILGVHAPLVQLKDGRLMSFGRGEQIDGRMPMSISADMGKTWNHAATEFPPVSGGQRTILRRLREGPLLYAYSGGCRTVIPISVGQRSNFCRTPFRFISDSVPG